MYSQLRSVLRVKKNDLGIIYEYILYLKSQIVLLTFIYGLFTALFTGHNQHNA